MQRKAHFMLVLTRCPGQGSKATICIGHEVEITVLGIDGDFVQVAVTAPPAISIAFDSAASGAPSSRVDKPEKRPVY